MVKKIIIITSVVIVAAALIVGGILLYQRLGQPPEPYKNAEGHLITIDTSKNFGACRLLDKHVIKSALGEPANNLQEPIDRGLVRIGSASGPGVKGDEAQLCTYSFESNNSAENDYGIGNSFSVEIYVHTDQASMDAALAAPIENEVPVDGLGQRAYFVTRAGLTSVSHRLTVFSNDLKHYTYIINQPSNGQTYDGQAAIIALDKIAESVGY